MGNLSRESQATINVGGFVPLTTIDYPGMISSVVFCKGCPWSCVYCHNQDLKNITSDSHWRWENILHEISSRCGFIDAVVFSGGEALLQNALKEAISDVKKLNLKVGLHTSGSYPERLEQILPLLDWVGMDVKHIFDKYQNITLTQNSGDQAQKSINVLINSGVSFETRMTVYPVVITTGDIMVVAQHLSVIGVKNFVLQKCRDSNNKYMPHSIFEDQSNLKELSMLFESFYVRD